MERTVFNPAQMELLEMMSSTRKKQLQKQNIYICIKVELL